MTPATLFLTFRNQSCLSNLPPQRRRYGRSTIMTFGDTFLFVIFRSEKFVLSAFYIMLSYIRSLLFALSSCHRYCGLLLVSTHSRSPYYVLPYSSRNCTHDFYLIRYFTLLKYFHAARFQIVNLIKFEIPVIYYILLSFKKGKSRNVM